jgi:mRNA (guanine-N7-)-methyltransferase
MRKAQEFYDTQARDAKRTKLDREQGALAWVRGFNNWVKSVLIAETCKRIGCINDHKTKKKRPLVYDFACGRGGDLTKWMHYAPAEYVGLDFSLDSILEAKTRAAKLKCSFPTQFYETDLRRSFRIPPVEGKVDIVSLQFAMHYFAKPETLKVLLENAAALLRPGGFLIGTVANGADIIQKAASKPEGFSNSLFSISYQKPPEKQGDPYTFSLVDAVSKVEEYTMTHIALQDLKDFQLVSWETFPQFCQAHRNQYDSWYKQWVDRFESSPCAWGVVNLYAVFVLKRLR